MHSASCGTYWGIMCAVGQDQSTTKTKAFTGCAALSFNKECLSYFYLKKKKKKWFSLLLCAIHVLNDLELLGFFCLFDVKHTMLVRVFVSM